MLSLTPREMTQQPEEIAALSELLICENVQRYLEIGCRYGGSLQYIAAGLPSGSVITAIDSGRGEGGGRSGQIESLQSCVKELSANGYCAEVFFGNSGDAVTQKFAAQRAPFDAIMIDADHSYDGVLSDWICYGWMARLVAFHDIACEIYGVQALWQKLKRRYAYHEYVAPGSNMGIGVIIRR